MIDHSVQVDEFGNQLRPVQQRQKEFERNRERYEFLKWGQKAFENFSVVPPATGIVHQVNLEYLAKVVMVRDGVALPDSLVGTDSHTTMINGLGVLGWGVGGIEAEACMLGPADLHGHAAGGRVQIARRNCPKDRPRPIWCWSITQILRSPWRGRKIRRILWRGLGDA